MNKYIFCFLLFSYNLICGQDRAENKMFSKFISSNSSILKSVTDKNGYQTQLVYASVNVTINNKFITLPRSVLILMRHHLKDSNNYTYAFISDQSANYSNTNLSDICLTKAGIGFCINFSGNNLGLNPAYPIYPVKPTAVSNCVYVEFDTLLNYKGCTKFSSSSSVNISRLVADSNEVKYAYLIYRNDLMMNNIYRFSKSGTFQNLFSFNQDSMYWSKEFTVPSSGSISPLQMLESKGNIYLLAIANGKNMIYDGNLFCKKSMLNYVVFKINGFGALTSTFETDTTNTLITTCSILVGDNQTILCLPYTSFIKAGNLEFKKTVSTNTGQVIFELDNSLQIKNATKLLVPSGTTTLKAISNSDQLMYFEVQGSIFNTVSRIVINDTILYISDWINYPGKTLNSTLFTYSLIQKEIIGAYDINTQANNTGYFVQSPENGSPNTYFQFYNRNDFLYEGNLYSTGNNTTIYSFTLKKPQVHVKHPYALKPKRVEPHKTIIEWKNAEVYDSLEIQKFSTFSGSTEYKFKAYGNATSFEDTMLSLLSSYQYKIRGYRNGWPSVYIASDSTPTTDSLKFDRFLIASVVDSHAIALTWGLEKTPASNIFYRSVYRSQQQYGTYEKIADIVPKTNRAFIDTTVKQGIRYYYFVSDYNYLYTVNTDTASAKTEGKVILLGSDFKIYPNPSTTILHVLLSDKSVTSFDCYDMLGRQFSLDIKSTDSAYYCDLTNLQSGVYTLICTQNGVQYKTKLVKR